MGPQHKAWHFDFLSKILYYRFALPKQSSNDMHWQLCISLPKGVRGQEETGGSVNLMSASGSV